MCENNPGKHWGVDLNRSLCITEAQTFRSNLKLRSSSTKHTQYQAPLSFSWWGTALRNKNSAHAVCSVPQLKFQRYRSLAALRNDVKHLPAPNSLSRGEFYLGQTQLRTLVCIGTALEIMKFDWRHPRAASSDSDEQGLPLIGRIFSRGRVSKSTVNRIVDKRNQNFPEQHN